MPKLPQYFSSILQSYNLKQAQESALNEPLLTHFEGGDDDMYDDLYDSPSSSSDEDDRNLVDKIDCLGRLGDNLKDKVYDVVKLETLFHKKVKFVDPTSSYWFFEFKDGKVFNKDGDELEEIEIDEVKRTVTGKLSEFDQTYTLGFDKRCLFIDQFKTSETTTKKNGYQKKDLNGVHYLHEELLKSKEDKMRKAVLPAAMLLAIYCGIKFTKDNIQY